MYPPRKQGKIMKWRHYGDCEWDSDKICMHKDPRTENMNKLGEAMGGTIDALYRDYDKDHPGVYNMYVGAGKVTYYTSTTLWRRFIMWFKKKQVFDAELEISKLNDSVKHLVRSLGTSYETNYWGSTTVPAFDTIRELRRDLDLILKHHKLCITYNKESVTLESCANKSGGTRGKA